MDQSLSLSHGAPRCGWQTSSCPELLPNVPEHSSHSACLSLAVFPTPMPLAGPLTPPVQLAGLRTLACGHGWGVRKSHPCSVHELQVLCVI